MRYFFKYFMIFVALLLIFNVLLFLGSLFPSSIIEKNVKKSSKQLNVEGNMLLFSTSFRLYNNNYTDARMINECYSIDYKNPIFSYMSARKNYKYGQTKTEKGDEFGESVSYQYIEDEQTRTYSPVQELSDFLDGNVSTSEEYARYWHGYLFFLRVLLILFDITKIRILLYIIFFILFIILLLLIKKKLGITIATFTGLSLLSICVFLVPYSLESSPIFLLMMASSIILLANIEKIKNIYTFLFIIGCCACYVDYLTVPLITLAMPLFLFLLYKQKNDQITLKDNLKIVFFSTLLWGLGYSLTWVSKWIIYDIFYNKNLIKTGFAQAFYRMSRHNNYSSRSLGDVLGILMKSYSSVIFVFYSFYIVLLLIISHTPLNKKYRIGLNNRKKILENCIPILIISSYPLVYYVLLANHTILHYGFTYRHMMIFVLGLLLCLNKCFFIYKNNN